MPAVTSSPQTLGIFERQIRRNIESMFAENDAWRTERTAEQTPQDAAAEVRERQLGAQGQSVIAPAPTAWERLIGRVGDFASGLISPVSDEGLPNVDLGAAGAIGRRTFKSLSDDEFVDAYKLIRDMDTFVPGKLIKSRFHGFSDSEKEDAADYLLDQLTKIKDSIPAEHENPLGYIQNALDNRVAEFMRRKYSKTTEGIESGFDEAAISAEVESAAAAKSSETIDAAAITEAIESKIEALSGQTPESVRAQLAASKDPYIRKVEQVWNTPRSEASERKIQGASAKNLSRDERSNEIARALGLNNTTVERSLLPKVKEIVAEGPTADVDPKLAIRHMRDWLSGVPAYIRRQTLNRKLTTRERDLVERQFEKDLRNTLGTPEEVLESLWKYYNALPKQFRPE